MGFDGSINIDSSIDGTGFSKGLDKLGSVAKTSLGAITGLIGGAATALGGAAAEGIKYNNQMEQYQTSFTVMLGSASKAQEMINNLQNFSMKTPFQMTNLADATKTLMGYGISAQDIMPDLEMLGDVSQGNSQKLQNLAVVFGQVQSAGKLQGEDLLQLVSNGFNPLQTISQQTGKSMAELRTEMEKGQISAQDVTNAFKAATSAGGLFYNESEAQAKTFNGQLSTLKDHVQMFLGSITGALTNSLKDTALPMVNGWLLELQSAFNTGGVNGVVGAFGNVLSQAVNAIASQAPQMINLAVLLIQSFVNGIAANAPELAHSAVQIVGALAQGIITLLPSIGNAALQLVLAIGNELLNDAPQISKGATGIINTIVNGLVMGLPQLINMAVQLIVALAQGLASHAPQIISGAQQVITTLVSALLQAAPQLAAAAVQLMAGFFGALMQQNPPAGIFLGVIGAVKGLQGAFSGLDAAANAAKNLQDMGGIADKIAAPFKNAGDNIKTIAGVATDAAGHIKDFAGGVADVAKGVGGGVVSGIKGFAGGIASVAKGAAGLIGSLADAAAGFVTMGAKAVASAAQMAIQEGASLAVAAAEKIQAAAQWLLDAAMDASPVTLFIIAIAAIVAIIILLWTHCQGFRDFIMAAGQAILGFLQGAASAIAGFFSAAWGVIQVIWGTVVGFFQGVWNGIVIVFSLVATWFSVMFGTAVAIVQAIWGSVVGFFQGVWNGIVFVFSAVTGWFGAIFGGAVGAIQAVWNTVVGFFSGVWSGIVGIFSAVGGWFGGVFSGAVNLVRGAWSGITGFFSGVWNEITGIFGSIGSWFGDRFNDAKNAIMSIFKPDMLTDLGGNLLKGLWNGIQDAIGWLVGEIKGLGGTILNAAKSALGIHSPSRLFRDEIGKMLPPGIALGFEASMPDAINDMQAQMDAMTAKMQASVATQQSSVFVGAAGAGAQTIDNSVTKSPVINVNGPVNVTDQGNQKQTLQQLQFLTAI